MISFIIFNIIYKKSINVTQGVYINLLKKNICNNIRIMGCDCKSCDCYDVALCNLILTRLNYLACIFDNVANSLIAIDQASILSINTSDTSLLYAVLPGIGVCTNTYALFGFLANPSIESISASAIIDEILNPMNTITFAETYNLYCDSTNIGLFTIADSVVPSNFIPFVNVIPGDAFLSVPVCMPTILANKPACLTCSPTQICVNAVCDVNSNATLLTNYSAIAQNLRSVAEMIACNNN